MTGLHILSGNPHKLVYAASGTINAWGDIMISGTQFKWDTIVVGNYRATSAPSDSLVMNVLGPQPFPATPTSSGVLTVTGDANAGFYYTVFNVTG
ncbi:MAG TPA: hypothetical protein ENI23_09720 [bacterium]|nr:hypothetical protein [bacterium]